MSAEKEDEIKAAYVEWHCALNDENFCTDHGAAEDHMRAVERREAAELDIERLTGKKPEYESD